MDIFDQDIDTEILAWAVDSCKLDKLKKRCEVKAYESKRKGTRVRDGNIAIDKDKVILNLYDQILAEFQYRLDADIYQFFYERYFGQIKL